jgi:hypothetical protein
MIVKAVIDLNTLQCETSSAVNELKVVDGKLYIELSEPDPEYFQGLGKPQEVAYNGNNNL